MKFNSISRFVFLPKTRLKHVINTKSQINIIFKDKIEKKKNNERRK